MARNNSNNGIVVAGADGCRGIGNWICVTRNLKSGALDSSLFHSEEELLSQEPSMSVLGIDIPIGLSATGIRECDALARRLLQTRSSSVFSPPCRAAISAPTYDTGSDRNYKITGKRLSLQAWGIVPKIRAVEEAILREKRKRLQILEVHPEVCFWAMNGASPGSQMAHNKKTVNGKRERRKLIAAYFGARAFDSEREKYLKRDVADDDLADAFAVLWTAERKYREQAVCLPTPAPFDERGLPMAIWY